MTDQFDPLMQDSITRYADYETTVQVSMETHLPENNIGYKLLQKMGWCAGEGLGPNGQGRIDPIRIELKDDALGVGKAHELNTHHVESTSKRKALDSEKQLEESESQRMEREFRAEKKQAIAKELQEVKRAFYCELCDKQYKKVSEYDQHLQSYDHHHKKRFKDMKETTRNSTVNQSEREKKLAREKRREEKELKRMQEAIQKKMGGTDQQVSKPVIPQLKPSVASSTANSNDIGGGWSSGGWSMSVPKVQTDQLPKIQTEQPPKVQTDKPPKVGSPKPDTHSVTLPSTSQTTSAPKKLAFGLKKSGFQFGLKKK
ncbi:hypothetical protein INT48_009190 [Thamnidium elegans]|uniref:G-patch domain-containing protein n=1 Tax=Thamnidium elegans TaxID=101142 RepID=A0A8H7SHD4_9FUNG|nr:hypothetical protein INT48_009190 [Thamnidium elegans]